MGYLKKKKKKIRPSSSTKDKGQKRCEGLDRRRGKESSWPG